MNKIFLHSCEKMPELSDNSVALTVTSPPYWNAIDYEIHATDKRQHYRTRAYNTGFSEYSEYLDWLERIFTEVLRITKPGGLSSMVIGTVLLDGKHYPVPFDVISRLTHSGWDFHQDIIWHKCTAGVKRAGVTIQKPYPGYYYPNIMTEYILVFRKPGPHIYLYRNSQQKSDAKFPINRLFTMDIANNIWHIAPVPPDYIDHPAPFPEEIPYRLITMYSYPDDLILDPFAGSGQTLKVARWLNRQYVGYEIIPKYVELSKQRINEPLAIRPQQLVAVFEKIGIDDPTASKQAKPAEMQKTQYGKEFTQTQLFESKVEYKKSWIKGCDMDFDDTIKKIASDLSDIPKYWDGKQVILEMRSADFPHWRQMEWIGFYFQFLCGKYLSSSVQIPGPKFDNAEFDGFLKIPWDFKAHAMNTSSHQIIVNDSVAISKGIYHYGSVGVILALGKVEYNDENRSFQQWHNTLKGNLSAYEQERIKRGAWSRLRKVSFDLQQISFVQISDDTLVKCGSFQENFRNSNGKARKAKVLLDLENLDKEIVYIVEF